MPDALTAAPTPFTPTPGPDIDPYRLRPEHVADPPRALRVVLTRIGPGMVMAASIVGSGELIATTTLGAQVGYTALWIILVSCIVKPVIQAEMGRYTIATGETALEAMNHVPGPRAAGAGWILWAWAITVAATLAQIGGMFGGVSQVMHLIVPALSVTTWVIVFLVITLALLLGGGYERIERFAMLKVGLFTLITVMAALVLLRMPEYFEWRDLGHGLTFDLPAQGLSTAVAVFGITGVGAVELFMYPYWCVEKGYARFAGAGDGSAAWTARARGWIRVMHLDIACSLVIYTMATVAFYLLGAGVLHARGTVPAAKDMIPVLSQIYTGTLGDWAIWPFYAGAVVTLYGTIFASIAAHSRVYADMCRVMGRFARDDYAARVRYRQAFIVVLGIVGAGAFLLVGSPVRMVVFGGVAQALMLPVVGAGTIYLRHRRLPAAVAPNPFVTVSLWLCTAATLAVAAYYLLSL